TVRLAETLSFWSAPTEISWLAPTDSVCLPPTEIDSSALTLSVLLALTVVERLLPVDSLRSTSTFDELLLVTCSDRSWPTSLFQSLAAWSAICSLPLASSKENSLYLPPPGLVNDLKVLMVGAPAEGAEGRLAPL